MYYLHLLNLPKALRFYAQNLHETCVVLVLYHTLIRVITNGKIYTYNHVRCTVHRIILNSAATSSRLFTFSRIYSNRIKAN